MCLPQMGEGVGRGTPSSTFPRSVTSLPCRPSPTRGRHILFEGVFIFLFILGYRQYSNKSTQSMGSLTLNPQIQKLPGVGGAILSHTTPTSLGCSALSSVIPPPKTHTLSPFHTLLCRPPPPHLRKTYSVNVYFFSYSFLH